MDAVLHTDLALSTILSLAYFPDKVEYMALHLANFLGSNESKLEIYPSDLEFGFNSILYLACALLNDAGYEKSVDTIKKYIRMPNISYEFAHKNLYSTDVEVVNDWVDQLAKFHMANSNDDLTLPFNHERWQFFPVEIISLLQLRSIKGISNKLIRNPLINDFILHLEQPLPVTLNDVNKKIEKRIAEAAG